ncbi:MAG: hypothetical protein FJZ58_00950 [Chlamydiae bacterium]|nr:hypothetical protein [Chlamydiota bacterium]
MFSLKKLENSLELLVDIEPPNPINASTNGPLEVILLHAIQKGSLHIVRFLLQNKTKEQIDCALHCPHKLTPLHFAILEQQEALIHYLVSRGASIDSPDIHGEEALPALVLALQSHKGFNESSTSIALYLAKHGAAINDPLFLATSESTRYITPFIYAIQHCSYDIITFFAKELGASMHARCEDGDTPLYYFLQMLADKEEHLSPSEQAKARSLFHLMVNLGANPSEVDEDGDSLLMRICGEDCTDLFPISLLVEGGADLHIVNNQGKTLLIDQLDVLSFYEEKNTANSNFWSHLSKRNQQCLKKQQLLQRRTIITRLCHLHKQGLNIEQNTPQGHTPLMYCIQENNLLGTLALLNLGANPNALDAQGKQAWLYALTTTRAQEMMQAFADHQLEGASEALQSFVQEGNNAAVGYLLKYCTFSKEVLEQTLLLIQTRKNALPFIESFDSVLLCIKDLLQQETFSCQQTSKKAKLTKEV